MKLFIIALPEEITYDFLTLWNKKEINGTEYFFNQNTNDVLVFSDVGKVNAAFTLTKALSEYVGIDLIINIGSCGTVNKNIDVFDVCMVKSCQFLDVDLTPFGYEINQYRKENKIFLMDKTISKEIESFVDVKHHTIVGTSDTFIGRNNYNNFIDINDVDLVEMELASLAMVASKFNKPIVSLKVVSDSIFNIQPSEEEYTKNAKIYSKQISDILDKIVHELK